MRIILASDGSPSAGIAVELVSRINWPEGTVVRVVHAIQTGTDLFGGAWPSVALMQAERIEAELRDIGRTTVEQAQARLERPGLEVASAVVHGRPATAILEAARAFDADLVALGSRGHGTLDSMLLGSVSAEIVEQAAAPVLVARRPTLERVVLAWDGSDCARVAADVLSTWPIFAGLPVRVVSVVDNKLPWWTGFPAVGTAELAPIFVEAAQASRRAHETRADRLVKELAGAGLDATAQVAEGDPATQIMAAAAESQADLVVLGTHGRTGLARLLLGSVARNVVNHATASVLVVRERGQHA